MARWNWEYKLEPRGGFALDVNRTRLPQRQPMAEPASRWRRENPKPKPPTEAEKAESCVLRLEQIVADALHAPTMDSTLRKKKVVVAQFWAELTAEAPEAMVEEVGTAIRRSIRQVGNATESFALGSGRWGFSLLTGNGILCETGPVLSKHDRESDIPDAFANFGKASDRIALRLEVLERDIAPLRHSIIKRVQNTIRAFGQLEVASIEEGRQIAAKINAVLSKHGLRLQLPDGGGGFLAYVVAGGKRGQSKEFFVRAIGHPKESLGKAGFGELVVVEAPADRRRPASTQTASESR